MLAAALALISTRASARASLSSCGAVLSELVAESGSLGDETDELVGGCEPVVGSAVCAWPAAATALTPLVLGAPERGASRSSPFGLELGGVALVAPPIAPASLAGISLAGAAAALALFLPILYLPGAAEPLDAASAASAASERSAASKCSAASAASERSAASATSERSAAPAASERSVASERACCTVAAAPPPQPRRSLRVSLDEVPPQSQSRRPSGPSHR